MCLEISPLIIYPMIDRLLGGSNADLFIPQRPLTQIEQRLVQRILDRATQHLSEAWGNVPPMKFKRGGNREQPATGADRAAQRNGGGGGFRDEDGRPGGHDEPVHSLQRHRADHGQLAAQNWFSYQRKGGQEDHVRG